MDALTNLISMGAPVAAIVVAIVAAVKARVPALDGWRVLVVAGGIALALVAVLMRPATVAGVWDALGTAIVAWTIAVGGDSWVSRLASKARVVSILDNSSVRKDG